MPCARSRSCRGRSRRRPRHGSIPDGLGYNPSMEKTVTIQDVRTFETRGGNVRYVVRDTDGDEYTTFRERIGEAAKALEGRRVQIECHEEQRGQYTNVYLDKVEPAPATASGDDGGGDTDPSE